MVEMSRGKILELGITAMKAGITEPEELERVIHRGVQAEWRIPLAQKALADVQTALRGMVE
jgi:hypothetical protein